MLDYSCKAPSRGPLEAYFQGGQELRGATTTDINIPYMFDLNMKILFLVILFLTKAGYRQSPPPLPSGNPFQRNAQRILVNIHGALHGAPATPRGLSRSDPLVSILKICKTKDERSKGLQTNRGRYMYVLFGIVRIQDILHTIRSAKSRRETRVSTITKNSNNANK